MPQDRSEEAAASARGGRSAGSAWRLKRPGRSGRAAARTAVDEGPELPAMPPDAGADVSAGPFAEGPPAAIPPDAGADVSASPFGEAPAVSAMPPDAGAGEVPDVAPVPVEAGLDVSPVAADPIGVDGGPAVATKAARGAKDLAGTVKEQAGQLTSGLVAQGRSVIDGTKTKLGDQANSRTERLAESLRRLGAEAEALAEGRPEDTSTLGEYLRQAADKCLEMADDIEARGVEGVIHEVRGFARRNPRAFVMSAAVAGAGVGRLLRSSAGGSGSGGPSPTSSDPTSRPRAFVPSGR